MNVDCNYTGQNDETLNFKDERVYEMSGTNKC